MTNHQSQGLSWFQIFRLGIVQLGIGGMVVITTSTLNRVMVVELLLPAAVPGLLVMAHYLVQMLRPRMGHGVDKGRKATPWIMGGLLILATGSIVSSFSIIPMFENRLGGLLIATVGFLLIGIGVSAAGTSLLTFLAKNVDEEKRAASAGVLWIMMIAGFAITAMITGSLLDPFTPARLFIVCSSVTFCLLSLALVAIWGLENRLVQKTTKASTQKKIVAGGFLGAISAIWEEKETRLFTLFVFASMFAFSMQDLILEPFAGSVFDLTPGETTKLSGMQHAGVFVGMIFVSIICSGRFSAKKIGSLNLWITTGCMLSCLALLIISILPSGATTVHLQSIVIFLGVSNGIFSIAAIGLMMQLAKEGGKRKEGIRMGLWGASQAIAFALGSLMGTVFSDLFGFLFQSAREGYATVFLLESAIFGLAVFISLKLKFVKQKSASNEKIFPEVSQSNFIQEIRG